MPTRGLLTVDVSRAPADLAAKDEVETRITPAAGALLAVAEVAWRPKVRITVLAVACFAALC